VRIELVLAVEFRTGDPNQLLHLIEIERDALATKTQAYPERLLQSNEGDAVLPEDAVEAFRPDGEDVGERRKSLAGIALPALGGAFGRRVDRGAEIAAGTEFHRHRDNRIL